MSQSDFVVLRVRGGEVRYGGCVFRPKLDASYLNGKLLAFGLYYTPTEPIDVNGVPVVGNKWVSDFIAFWGTQHMLETMQRKGWPSQWKQEDINLLQHPDTGSRIGVLIWKKVESYS